jgi:hypothetical protein
LYTVTRGVHGTQAVAHLESAPVYHLLTSVVIMPFPAEFFGSPYSGGWNDSIASPDVRIASAQMFVTNQKGNSPSASIFLTHTIDNGFRTLSGGQYSIQVDGYLAVDASAAPVLVVDAAHSVRDVFGVLGSAADAPIRLQLSLNGAAYCQITFPAGASISNSVDGFALPPLTSGSQLTLSILSVGQTNPGSDLTVIIRL